MLAQKCTLSENFEGFYFIHRNPLFFFVTPLFLGTRKHCLIVDTYFSCHLWEERGKREHVCVIDGEEKEGDFF